MVAVVRMGVARAARLPGIGPATVLSVTILLVTIGIMLITSGSDAGSGTVRRSADDDFSGSQGALVPSLISHDTPFRPSLRTPESESSVGTAVSATTAHAPVTHRSGTRTSGGHTTRTGGSTTTHGGGGTRPTVTTPSPNPVTPVTPVTPVSPVIVKPVSPVNVPPVTGVSPIVLIQSESVAPTLPSAASITAAVNAALTATTPLTGIADPLGLLVP